MKPSQQRSRGRARTVVLAILAVLLLGGGIAAFRLLGSDHVEGAIARYDAGDYERGARSFDRILAREPANAEARYYRGLCRRQLKKFREAVEDFAALRGLPEWAPRAFAGSVLTCLDARWYDQAKDEVEQADAAILASSSAREAVGLFHMETARKIERDLSARFERELGTNESRSLTSQANRVMRYESRNHTKGLQQLSDRLESTNMGVDERTTVESDLIRGHEAVVNAINAFREAVEAAETKPGQPEVPTARHELAMIYDTRSRQPDAEVQLRKLALMQDEAARGDRRILREIRNWRSVAREVLAAELESQGRHQECIDLIDSCPKNELGDHTYELEVQLVEASAALGRDDVVLDITKKWLVRRDYREMHFLRGRYWLDKGEPEKALPDLERCVAGSNRKAEFLEVLARCYMSVKRYAEAAAIYDDLVKRRPDDWRLFLDWIRSMEGLMWLEDARQAFATALTTRFQSPGSEANRELRAALERFLERYDLAPRDLYTAERLYKDDQSNHDVGRRYLDFLLDEGAIGKARGVAARLLKVCPVDDPSRFNVLLACGRFEAQSERYEAAVSLYQEAALLKPWEPEPRIRIADLFVKLGKRGAAWKQIESAEALAADDPRLPGIRFSLDMAEGNAAAAAAEAQIILAKLPPRAEAPFELVRDTARCLIGLGRNPEALKMLGRIPLDDRLDPARAITLALLRIEAGEDAAAKQLAKVLIASPDDRVLIRDAASRLAEMGRDDLIVSVIRPALDEMLQPDEKTLAVLAKAYRDLRRDDDFLAVAEKLLHMGKTSLAYEWIAGFCFEQGRKTEVLSIADAADRDNATSTTLAWTAARTALAEGDLDRARRYLKKLRGSPEVDEADLAIIDSRLSEAAGEYVAALDLLEAGLRRVRGSSRSELWVELIDLLGRKSQFDTMLTALQRASNDRPADLAPAVAALHRLIAADDPRARGLVDLMISRAPNDADVLTSRGILRFETGEAGALEDFEAAWKAKPSQDTARALAIAMAGQGKSKALKALFDEAAKLPGTSKRLGQIRNDAEFARLLAESPAKAADAASLLGFPTRAEASAFAGLVSRGTGDPGITEEFRKAVGRWLLFRDLPLTERKAAKAVNLVLEVLPREKRAVSLLSARTLMSDKETFNQGVRLVTPLLDASEMKDEAALCLYAEAYLANGETQSLELLLGHVISTDGLPDTFFEDLAGILLEHDLPLSAARVLYRSTSKEPAKIEKEALALYRSGNLERAARLLSPDDKEVPSSSIGCQIVGEARLRDVETLRSGYDLASRAVYAFSGCDPTAYLTLARASYRVGEKEEARKNLDRWMALDPASAQTVAAAFEIVRQFGARDAEYLSRLDRRRVLLDPSGYFVVRKFEDDARR